MTKVAKQFHGSFVIDQKRRRAERASVRSVSQRGPLAGARGYGKVKRGHAVTRTGGSARGPEDQRQRSRLREPWDDRRAIRETSPVLATGPGVRLPRLRGSG